MNHVMQNNFYEEMNACHKKNNLLKRNKANESFVEKKNIYVSYNDLAFEIHPKQRARWTVLSRQKTYSSC